MILRLGVSLTFSAGGQLVFTGGKTFCTEILFSRWLIQLVKLYFAAGQCGWYPALSEICGYYIIIITACPKSKTKNWFSLHPRYSPYPNSVIGHQVSELIRLDIRRVDSF